MKKLVSLVLAVLLCLGAAAADLDVYFPDVGQGDASVVICDGEVMMIDGGDPKKSQFIYAFLTDTLGIDHIGYMVATHADADHIGGLSAALNAASVDTIFSPMTECDTKTFQSLLKYAAQQGLSLTVPQTGDSFMLGGANVTFIGPVNTYADDNNNSLIVRIVYEDIVFLFMGDAQKEAEEDLLKQGADLKAAVLKVGHHGSASSSSPAFIEAVQPEYAVISVGAGNQYGHPKDSVLETLENTGATILRTDLNGTIRFHIGSDGSYIKLEKNK